MDTTLDSGLHALLLLARLHGISASPPVVRHRLARDPARCSATDLLRAARGLGLKASLRTLHWQGLARIPLPALVELRGDGYLLLAAAGDDEVLLRRPSGELTRMARGPFTAAWTGWVLSARPHRGAMFPPSGFTWFWQHLHTFRSALLEVLVLSLCLNLLGLVPPLVFQTVIDKVLVHHAWTTLDVLCAGLVLVTLFDTVAASLRPRLLAQVTSRLDLRLGVALFEHLMRIPLAYFEARRVGDTLARVRELEHIRSFLAGTAPTLLLDLVFVLFFCSMLTIWSPSLSLVVFLSFPVLILLVALSAPALRVRIEQQFTSAADLQACLVETVGNMRTVKAVTLEAQQTRRWTDLSAAAAEAGLRTSLLASPVAQLTAAVQKAVSVILLWFGARQVIEGQLTPGELVAFNLFAARATQPLLRLAQGWQEWVQVRVSMQRVDALLKVLPEPGTGAGQDLPALQGSIRFERVGFRYAPDQPSALRDLDFRIAPGEIIAIVGASGSGKSTVAALLQRLYLPTQGRVFIDDRDTSALDGSTLRCQIGVVTQESRLFNRSIRENIAIRDPSLPLESVMGAARAAGAHDFIAKLPAGYDTLVHEQGVSLSGGQVQRIALARALITRPAILILDEFTSALDALTENFLARQLPVLAEGRTVIMVTHRAALAGLADRVLVLAEGCLVQQGRPELLARLSGPYQRLWQQAAVR
jgi:subfamily B ATP-binding cassette protein HlyB/CyaB